MHTTVVFRQFEYCTRTIITRFRFETPPKHLQILGPHFHITGKKILISFFFYIYIKIFSGYKQIVNRKCFLVVSKDFLCFVSKLVLHPKLLILDIWLSIGVDDYKSSSQPKNAGLPKFLIQFYRKHKMQR